MKKLTKTEIQKRWDALQIAKQAYKSWGEVTEYMAQIDEPIKTKAGTFTLVDKMKDNRLTKFVFVDRYEVQFKKVA